MDTLFRITVKGCKSPNELKLLNNEFDKIGIIDTAVCAGEFVDNYVVFENFDYYNWYNIESEMRILSMAFPNMRFKIECMDEEAYAYYFSKGLAERCEGHIVYDEPEKIIW